MSEKLEPCPFCGEPLFVRKGVNPYGRCETQGCWMSDRKMTVPLHDEAQVAAWNARTPANGEQVERGPGLLDDGMCQEHGRWLCSRCLRGHTLVAEDPTPTQDTRERVKALEEALRPFARTDVLEPNGLIVGLERYHFDRARTALGNQEERL